MPEAKSSDKEREAKLKALREELEEQIERDLASNLPAGERVMAPAESIETREISPKRILEALLFASAKPLTVPEIRKILQGVSAKEVEGFVAELQEEYGEGGRSFELIEIAGGYEMVTKKEFSPWLARLELQRKIRQASRSALETLAILAYKQPVTRAEIEELRGVDVAAVLSTLLEKGFIKITGRKEVPGRPFLYGTTEKFLEHFGLKSLAGLPNIGEIKSLVERAVRREELIGEAQDPSSGRNAETVILSPAEAPAELLRGEESQDKDPSARHPISGGPQDDSEA